MRGCAGANTAIAKMSIVWVGVRKKVCCNKFSLSVPCLRPLSLRVVLILPFPDFGFTCHFWIHLLPVWGERYELGSCGDARLFSRAICGDLLDYAFCPSQAQALPISTLRYIGTD